MVSRLPPPRRLRGAAARIVDRGLVAVIAMLRSLERAFPRNGSTCVQPPFLRASPPTGSPASGRTERWGRVGPWTGGPRFGLPPRASAGRRSTRSRCGEERAACETPGERATTRVWAPRRPDRLEQPTPGGHAGYAHASMRTAAPHGA